MCFKNQFTLSCYFLYYFFLKRIFETYSGYLIVNRNLLYNLIFFKLFNFEKGRR